MVLPPEPPRGTLTRETPKELVGQSTGNFSVPTWLFCSICWPNPPSRNTLLPQLPGKWSAALPTPTTLSSWSQEETSHRAGQSPDEFTERPMWEGTDNHHQPTSHVMTILKTNLPALVKPLQLMPYGQRRVVPNEQISEQNRCCMFWGGYKTVSLG